ncbi:MAG: hypothetical protein ACRDQZ_04290 [Mycobacteriales bacterium]
MGSVRKDDPSSTSRLFEQAAAARAAGDVDGMATALAAAFAAARSNGDTAAMAAAALALPSGQRFGVHPGQVPALLHEIYTATEDPATRCRLAAALTRSWVYGGDAARAAQFAEEAERLAVELDLPELVADALDAALVARWGPDDFAERVSLAARLDNTAAHLTDTDLRLRAHLWRLTTAWECLDIVAVHRQLRALDLLAHDSGSPLVAFFAASRRAMHALAVSDLALADELIAHTERLASQAAPPDAEAVLHCLFSVRARQGGDLVALRAEAEAFDGFSTSEGIPSVAALTAVLWLDAGEPERAGTLVDQVLAGGFEGIALDVDFLLSATCALGVAVDLGRSELARSGIEALEPYAGRAVLNAGAVGFHGLVDDYLSRAAQLLDDPRADQWRHVAESAYRRLGATWWQQRLGGRLPSTTPARTVHLHPDSDGGAWVIGAPGAKITVPNAKGLHYLRELVRRPGVDIAAVALSDAASGHPGHTMESADLGETLDREALASYRRRLAELDAALDDADARGDQASAERLQHERDVLLGHVRAATGLGGRRRRTGSTDERARTAVRKALTATFVRIEANDRALARLLRDTIRTGTNCRYDPQPGQPITWITE